MNVEHSTQVYISDKCWFFQVGLKAVLTEFGYTVVGMASTAAVTLSEIGQAAADVVLIDSNHADMHAVDFVTELRRMCPGLIVVVITDEERTEVAYDLLAAGATGYCLKSCNAAQLKMAIDSTRSGAIWLDASIGHDLVKAAEHSHATTPPVSAITTSMTPRELEVLTLLIEGLSNQQMANRLQLSPETVKTHMGRIMEKLGVHDRTQAAVKVLKSGITTLASVC